jgi:hypothetical protein
VNQSFVTELSELADSLGNPGEETRYVLVVKGEPSGYQNEQNDAATPHVHLRTDVEVAADNLGPMRH